MTPTSVTAQKQELRRIMIQRRREMPGAVRAAADQAVLERVMALPALRDAAQVFAYVSMPHEVGTRELLKALLAAGKTVGLPVCRPETRQMDFYRLDSTDELQCGAYRIPVPPALPERLLTPDEKTLMLVPMLAFDACGYRLGAGGGYYDRWLAANPVRTAGICYAGCKVDSLPHDENDRRLMCCITEDKQEDFYG